MPKARPLSTAFVPRQIKQQDEKEEAKKKHTLKWGKKWARTYETNAHNIKRDFFISSLIWLKPKQSNVKNVAGGD